jgi:hypothetical protein
MIGRRRNDDSARLTGRPKYRLDEFLYLAAVRR